MRSTLVVALIGLPVATGIAAMTLFPLLVGDGQLRATAELGTADVRVDGPTRSMGVDVVPPITELDGGAFAGSTIVTSGRSTAWVSTGDDGWVSPLEVEQVDAADPLVRSRLRLEQGRRPERPGEVMLTQHALEEFGLEVGDDLHLAVPDVELRVVGVTRLGDNCSGGCDAAVVAPGTFAVPSATGPDTSSSPFDARWSDRYYVRVSPQAAASVSQGPAPLGVDLAALQSTGYSFRDRDSVTRSGTSPRLVAAWTVVGGSFVLFWAGLVASSGLAVGARRRKHELGILAANGADPRSLRLAVVAEGLVLGTVGAVAGVTLGLAVAVAAAPAVRDATDSFASTIEVPPVGVAALACCGVLAAVLASRAASSGLTRLTPADLLAGRQVSPRPAPAWLAAGGVLMVVGTVGLQFGRSLATSGGRAGVAALMYAASVGALAVGTVAFVVGCTRLAGTLTTKGTVSLRLAGRDLSRQGLRIAAACGAVSLTLCAAMALATSYESNRHLIASDTTPTEVRDVAADRPIGEVVAERDRLIDGQIVPAQLDTDTLGAVAARGWKVGSMAYQLADGVLDDCATPLDGASTEQTCTPASVIVVDDAMLQLMPSGLSDRIAAGQVVSLAPRVVTTRTVDGRAVEVTSATAPGDPSSPRVYFTSNSIGGPNGLYMRGSTAASLGVDLRQVDERRSFVELADHGPRSAAALDELLSADGLRVAVTDATDDDESRWFLLAGAAGVSLVTLLIVLLALALVRVESRGDDDVLLITGASPGLGRRVQGARAGLMVLVAAVPAPFVGWALVRGVSGRSTAMAWWAIELLVLLPIACAGVAAVCTRTPRRLRTQ